METECAAIPGLRTEPVILEELGITRAKAFAMALAVSDSSRFVECRKITAGLYPYFFEDDEMVIFDADIDVGQRPVNDIRYTERIAILFFASDAITPMVFALRDSFPDVLHRISMPFEKPACLCIYDQPWDQLKLNWRPIKFIDDIRSWLSKTGDSTLHPDDQPLEPLLLHFYGQVILPCDFQQGESLFLQLVNEYKQSKIFIAAKKPLQGNTSEFQVLALAGKQQVHGIIPHSPRNLADLQQFLLKAGIDLVDGIKKFVDPFATDVTQLKKHLMILVVLPKSNAIGTINSIDYYSFLLEKDIHDIVTTLNVIENGPVGIGRVLFPAQVTIGDLVSIRVETLVPYITLNPESAQILSTIEPAIKAPAITQVGAGSIGSQLFINLAKTGYGRWKLIDDDIMLPHNTVRHYLDQRFLGAPKSIVLSNMVNQTFEGEDIAEGIQDNYLSPLNSDVLDIVLESAEVIVDCSASVPVARDLAQRNDLTARRISVFLNPKGTDLVVLGEDKDRNYSLDVLEYQYYRELVSNPILDEHLQSSDRIRYANSCRDITSRLPQELVALHAAVGAANLKKFIASDDPQITIWHSADDLSVQRINVPVTKFEFAEIGEWKVYVDDYLISEISDARLAKLPNETGGVLIGGYDFHRKIIYLVDTILSPPDSEESPGGYVRGTEGLKDALDFIQSKTAGHLRYAGEWHSHPENYPPTMSTDDRVLFLELSGKMKAAGLRTLMLIAADDKEVAIYMD